jgi:predicted nucleotidyltransferase
MGSMIPSEKQNSGLFNKTRQAVLALLYGHDDESFYLRQIVRAVRLGQGSVQRELARLTRDGYLIRTRRGNQVYFQVNRHSPVFAELKMLVMKTGGATGVLQTALAKLSERTAVAFLYGSIVTGTDRSGSDVDLIVVGDVTFAEVVAAVRPAQEILQREVNPSVYSPAEFRKKIQAGHHFLSALLKAPKIFLDGTPRELTRLASKRLAD